MGCSTSKLNDEEVVQLCKDRKRFIKQAVEQRARFASGHLAYIQSLKRVSAALRDYIKGDRDHQPHDFLLDSFITPPFTPPSIKKKLSPDFFSISPKSFPPPQIQTETPSSTLKVNYLRSGGNPAVSVEESPPQSPETVRVEAYSPSMQYQFGFDGFFPMQSTPLNPSSSSYSFFSYSPNRSSTNYPPPSPQTSQWDFFWNPFNSLGYYGYPNNQASLEQTMMDSDIRGLRQLHEEEGIPDLEDDIELDEPDIRMTNVTHERAKVDVDCNKEEVIVEDVDEDDEEDDDGDNEDEEGEEDQQEEVTETTEHETRGLQQSGGGTSLEISRSQMARQVEASNQEMTVGDGEVRDEMPGFTVYVNRRPTSMAEVIKELDDQFMVVCSAASEVSAMLDARKAQYSAPSSELTVKKILNPVALIRSASSRSSSSRFLANSSSTAKEEDEESSSDFSEECMFSGSHQSTLDRLYAWEKKLCDEVQSGERFRIAYEKKCMRLRNHDVEGDDLSSVEKTRIAIRDLHTQIKVSMHSVEAISKRIETLRDEELEPQLLKLVKGLSRMWKVMAECHQSQKRTLDEAKLVLAGTPSKLDAKKHSFMSVSEPQKVARLAANLESELRNWRACFKTWITSQLSYVHALSGWLLRCVRSDPDISMLPFSPLCSSGALPIFGLCIQWSRSLDAMREAPVLDGLDFFAAGMGSLNAQKHREDSKRFTIVGMAEEGRGNGMEVVEVGREVEDVMTVEKMAEVAIRVLCAGMSVAMSSLTEFSFSSAKGYAELVNQWESANWPHDSGGTGEGARAGM